MYTAAEVLTNSIIEYQLQMLLLLRTITCKKNNKQLTLDLTLATKVLASKVVACQITDIILGLDHLLIETAIQLDRSI